MMPAREMTRWILSFHCPLYDCRGKDHHSLCICNPPSVTTSHIIHTTIIQVRSSSTYELKDFVGAKFYCLHAFAYGNQQIAIRYGIFTCAQKLTRWPAKSSARQRNGKNGKLKTKASTYLYRYKIDVCPS